MDGALDGVRRDLERGVRSLTYNVRYGTGFKVPKLSGSKEEPIDMRLKRLYMMPAPKGALMHNASGFDDDGEDGEEEEEDEEGGAGGHGAAGGRSSLFGLGRQGMSSLDSSRGDRDSESTESSTKQGEKEEDEGEDGEEDDDGFGAINISAQRLPKEDNALTRFFRRAIANNGEAAQISHLKNMEWVAPRSDEEILATLDPRFYEETFDPSLHMLETLPKEAEEDFNSFIVKQLSEKDVAREHIMSQLATRVEANYHLLIEGMKNIQDVDVDLVKADVQCRNSRRKISMADNNMRLPFLKVIHKRVRRENLQRAASIVKAAHEVLALEREAREAAAQGRFDRAVTAATDAKLSLDSELLLNVNMMESTRQELDRLLPGLRLEADKALRRLCAHGFKAADYAWVLKAYLTLDDHGVRINSRDRSLSQLLGGQSAATAAGQTPQQQSTEDSLLQGIIPVPPAVDRGGIPGLIERLQRFVGLEIDYRIKTSIIKTILAALAAIPPAPAKAPAKPMLPTTTSATGTKPTAAGPGAVSQPVAPAPAPAPPALPEVVRDVNGRVVSFKGKKLADWQVPDLAKMLPAGNGFTALQAVAASVAEVLHTYFLVMQWHRSPFDERNNDVAFLHRPNPLDQKAGDVGGGDLSEDEEEEEDDDDESTVDSENKQRKSRDSRATVEEEEEEGDETEDDGFESMDEGMSKEDEERMDAAEQSRLYKERRLRLERARLATVSRGLRQARRALWEPVDKAAAILLHEGSADSLTIEAFVQILATGELLVAIGEEFGRNESHGLRKALRAKARGFYDKINNECFTVMRQMLDRETWYHVPISLDTLGGIAGVLSSHTKNLTWPYMNGSGSLVRERAMRAARKKSGERLASDLTPLPGVLSEWFNKGNPFIPLAAPGPSSGQDKPRAPAEVATPVGPLVFDPATETLPFPVTVATPGGTPGSPPSWSITQAALNGFCKYATRYMQLMGLMPSLALEAYGGLCDLLEFYIYMVFVVFTPDQTPAILLAQTPHLDYEDSVMTELNWVNADVHLPVRSEVEEELQHIRTFLMRVKEAMIEVEVSSILAAGVAAVETASKLKKLTGDAAKKLTALGGGVGAGSSKGSELMGHGHAGGGVHPPAPAPGGHHHSQGLGQASHTISSPSDPGHSPTKAKKFKVSRPAMIADALEDPGTLFGLSQRAVAVESIFFIIEVLKCVQPRVQAILGKKAAFNGPRGSCESFIPKVVEAVTQLRVLAYRCAAPKLIRMNEIVRGIEAGNWNVTKLREEANAYVDTLCGHCREVWSKVHGPEQEEDGSMPMGGGLDNMYIPPHVQLLIWGEVVQVSMIALLEGFSRVEKCSTEGRASMSMDLQALQLGLDDIQRARPTRGKVYVDAYVKAFYYGESDVMVWIQQNWRTYHFRHMAGLLNAGVGPKKKKKGLKEMIIQVAAFYHPEAATMSGVL